MFDGIIFDILGGMWAGFQVVSFCLAAELLIIYAGRRSDAKDIKPFRWWLLLSPLIVFVYQAEHAGEALKGKPAVYLIAAFAVFLLGAWTMVCIGLKEYNRGKT